MIPCKRISYEQKETLKQALDSFEQAVNNKEASEIAKADVVFHDAIFAATGNMRLGQMVNNLAEQMYRYRFEYIKDEGGRQRLIEEHKKIFDAVISGDVVAATKEISVHIKNQEDSIIQLIRMEKCD